MGYFESHGINCAHYTEEWSRVVNQINSWGFTEGISREVTDPLEAKALYVFTVARRLRRAAYSLYERYQRWQPIFLDATVLLFPMLELVGYSRVDDAEVSQHYSRPDVSNVNLWAGLHWLRDPEWLAIVQDNKQKEDNTLLHSWEIGHLVSLRHFLLHGSKNARDKYGDPLPIQDIVNYQLPGFLYESAMPALTTYWRQLCQDDGSSHWLIRLAGSDIRPLPIKGSTKFEEGLVDPDIVVWLEA